MLSAPPKQFPITWRQAPSGSQLPLPKGRARVGEVSSTTPAGEQAARNARGSKAKHGERAASTSHRISFRTARRAQLAVVVCEQY